jgi:hypothetical protein
LNVPRRYQINKQNILPNIDVEDSEQIEFWTVEDCKQVENYEQVEACSMHIYIYMQLVPIITKVVSLNRAHGEVHW